MTADFVVQGAEELDVIARHLKQIGDKELRKELLAGINRATKPLRADVKRSAQEKLPRKGGLNKTIAGAKYGTQNRTSGRNVGVRITGKWSGHDIRAIDRGRVRHPVFGNRQVWVMQDVTPGFFTKPLEAGADTVRREVLDVLEDVARRLVDGR